MSRRDTVVSPGDEVEIAIESVNHQGEGVGRYRGLAVFVPCTVPGEQVTARITAVKKNFATAEPVRVVTPSDRRVKPSCPVFQTCGGCQFQHMDYGLQLELKRRLVEDSLKRIGRITGVPVHPVIGMDNPWKYRNKAQYQVTEVDGRLKLGFFEEGTHNLVPHAECLLLDRDIAAIANMVEGMLEKYKIPAYNWEAGTGVVRHVVVRKSRQTAKIMVVLVTSAEKCTDLYVMANEMRSRVPRVVSVVRNINAGPGRHVFGRDSQLLAGQASMTDRLGGLTFTVSPTSFFQVNPVQTELLYAKALEYAGPAGDETVLDVYCGVGTLSLLLAQRAGRVYGFDVLPEAVRDAAANARQNKITNAEFVSGKAEVRLPNLVRQGVSPSVVVVDPPRQGIEKRALQAIADMKPERIVYVSCDPGTMARDLSFLSYRGYQTVEVQPVDMFPQTSHVECVTLMSRVKK